MDVIWHSNNYTEFTGQDRKQWEKCEVFYELEIIALSLPRFSKTGFVITKEGPAGNL